MPPRLHAVLFDLGNTLIYFDGAGPEVLTRADQALLEHLRAAGLKLEEASFLKEFRARLDAYFIEREAEFIEHTTGYVLKTLLAELGYPDLSPDVLRPALKSMYAVSQAHWHTEEDTLPTLEALRARGYRLGVISNAGDDDDVQTLVDNANMRPYFDQIISSAAVGIRKPNPRIFEMALEHWGIAPQQAVMVGDTLGADILGGKNANIFTIWITRHADTPANRVHNQTISPDARINTLAELPDLLHSLEG